MSRKIWPVIFGLLCTLPALSQTLPIETMPFLDQDNNIRNYLIEAATRLSRNSLAGIATLKDWQAVKEQRLQDFIDMMGLVDAPFLGERPDLNPTITGTLQKQGYRIEKLYYESLPQLYVPANLYIPDDIKKPAPAILYVCGHARSQKVHYQAHARKFAQLGFVCLIIETIQWGEVRGDHWGCYANGWFHWYSRGYTPGGVELWNAIRGLDLLCERPEVDASNLGVTGISGGGSQSWYIAAADPRIKAVAPVCGASTMEAHIHTRTIDGHCDCMMPINTYGRDYADIGALIAPRPLLIGQADRDGLNTIESVRDIYSALKTIYSMYDAADNIGLVETPGGHSYHALSRTEIFSFFLKHLMNKEIPPALVGDVDESETSQLAEDELRVYGEGPPADDRTTTIQESFIKAAHAPELTSLDDVHNHRAKVIDFLNEKTFAAFPDNPAPLDMKREFRSLDGGTFGWDVISFVSERGWRLRIDIRRRHPKNEMHPMMLVLRSPDEPRWASEAFVSELDNRWNIAYVQVRGVGEAGWAENLNWHVRRAAAWTGRTVASMQVYDVLRCLEALRTLDGVNSNDIGIAARDEMSVVALYAALMDGRVSSLLLKNPPATQNAPSSPDGRGAAIEMLNCLRITDAPQIAGLLFPTQITITGKMPQTYDWARSIYVKLGKPNNFLEAVK